MAFCPRHSPGVWVAPPVSRNWKGGTAGQAPIAPKHNRATKNIPANRVFRISRGMRIHSLYYERKPATVTRRHGAGVLKRFRDLDNPRHHLSEQYWAGTGR